MGICGNICNHDNKLQREINVDQLNSPNRIITYIANSKDYPQLIYLQLRIKRYLRKVRIKSKGNTKINLSQSKQDTASNSRSLEAKANLISNFKDNAIGQNIRNNITDKVLISQDPFKSKVSNKNITRLSPLMEQSDKSNQCTSVSNCNTKVKVVSNDPRDQEHNNIRQMYPEIEEDGFTYIGEWKNGMRDGFGVLSLKDISKYIGEFKENVVFGFGILFDSEKGKSVGYWDDFKANGLGYYISSNGCSSKGYWINDRLNGYGIETDLVARYEGEYSDGVQQGIGIKVIEERGTYIGEIDESLYGIGMFVFKDGRKYEGEWKNNKLNGFGIISLPNKKSWFEGEFIDDKREGFGVFYSPKKIYVGMWKNSKLEGETIIIQDNIIKKQYWENGKVVKNLPNDYTIFYEKYIPEVISTYKKVSQ